ncbi:MAG: DUF5985 family protein [Thermoanaerobaculia bacterium]
MANAIYILCSLTSAICAWLLLRGYSQSRARLLFWSGLCFVGLCLNNVLLVVDIRVGPALDLSTIRTLPALAGVALLLYGLIWEAR